MHEIPNSGLVQLKKGKVHIQEPKLDKFLNSLKETYKNKETKELEWEERGRVGASRPGVLGAADRPRRRAGMWERSKQHPFGQNRKISHTRTHSGHQRTFGRNLLEGPQIPMGKNSEVWFLNEISPFHIEAGGFVLLT